ncbi:putative alpha-galactosidase D [Venturia inaequalis]|uniref:Uncharacterized protein n=1 Tax=Venturia inaequalis TaxID=5025 RepID=A0A8H3VNB4_VENIN|nr:hypothetical protein EG327_009323 [Venturia inaequalis]RDI84521.1 putative alpha-galactosidase D [Venturia inaequalis]
MATREEKSRKPLWTIKNDRVGQSTGKSLVLVEEVRSGFEIRPGRADNEHLCTEYGNLQRLKQQHTHSTEIKADSHFEDSESSATMDLHARAKLLHGRG